MIFAAHCAGDGCAKIKATHPACMSACVAGIAQLPLYNAGLYRIIIAKAMHLKDFYDCARGADCICGIDSTRRTDHI